MKKPVVVGIDIGGTNTVFGIVNEAGEILSSGSIKTAAYAKIEDYIESLTTSLKQLISDHNLVDKIEGIGVGAPNANYFTGNIEAAANLPWKGVIPLTQMISEAMGIPTVATNDANAAAIGEMTYGATRDIKDFIMITLGTGLGSGIVINGEMVYGHDGFAGELGHIIVNKESDRLCGCGNYGCLETYVSATGLLRTAQQFLKRDEQPSLMREIPSDQLTSKSVYEAAIAGDVLAKEVFTYTGTILGEALANFVLFSSPKAFVLFGGLAQSGDILMQPVKESFDKNIFPVFRGKIDIILSQLKESDAAVLGASALGWDATKCR